LWSLRLLSYLLTVHTDFCGFAGKIYFTFFLLSHILNIVLTKSGNEMILTVTVTVTVISLFRGTLSFTAIVEGRVQWEVHEVIRATSCTSHSADPDSNFAS
jgi:hypothetical protein